MENKFRTVRKGYSPEEVDDYISKIETELNNYKKKETAINNALIAAQITADATLKEAEIASNNLKQTTADYLNDLKDTILEEKRKIGNFYDEYNSLIEKYLRTIDDDDIEPVVFKLSRIVELIETITNEISSTSATKVYPLNIDKKLADKIDNKVVDKVTNNNVDINNNVDKAANNNMVKNEQKVTITETNKKVSDLKKTVSETAYVIEDDDKEIVFKFPKNPSAQDDGVRQLLNKK